MKPTIKEINMILSVTKFVVGVAVSLVAVNQVDKAFGAIARKIA